MYIHIYVYNVYLSIYLSIYLSGYLSICLSFYIYIYCSIEELLAFLTQRSSHSQMFFKIGFLEYFATFTVKHPCRSLFLIKLQKEKTPKRLQSRCFPVNFAEFLRTVSFNGTPPLAASKPMQFNATNTKFRQDITINAYAVGRHYKTLINLSLMHPFYTPCKHQKTRGQRKVALGTNGLLKILNGLETWYRRFTLQGRSSFAKMC